MNIRTLKQESAEAMAVAREPKKAIGAYVGISAGLSLALSTLSWFLSRQGSGAGGLAALDQQALLSTIETIMPLFQSLFLVCLEMGYFSAVLRFGRKQYADHTDLKTGLALWGPTLRLMLFRMLIYLAVMILSANLSSYLFLLTPFANSFTELMTPEVQETMLTDPGVLDAQTTAAIYRSIAPMFVIMVLVFAAFAIPISYRYRMANYVLLDHPRAGALAAMRGSRIMMRGNAISLLKLDLSYWWYYALTFLATLLCYADLLLPLAGIALPTSSTFNFFLFLVLYVAAQSAIFWFFRNPMEVTYVRAYEAIRPQETDSGVVLGNIFQM